MFKNGCQNVDSFIYTVVMFLCADLCGTVFGRRGLSNLAGTSMPARLTTQAAHSRLNEVLHRLIYTVQAPGSFLGQ